jgi:hypothetical protein
MRLLDHSFIVGGEKKPHTQPKGIKRILLKMEEGVME